MVTVRNRIPAYGNMVEIDHGNGLITRYAHTSKVFVKTGDMIKRGQTSPRIGTTGRSTGPHLHFEVLVQGVPQDPHKFLAGGPGGVGDRTSRRRRCEGAAPDAADVVPHARRAWGRVPNIASFCAAAGQAPTRRCNARDAPQLRQIRDRPRLGRRCPSAANPDAACCPSS